MGWAWAPPTLKLIGESVYDVEEPQQDRFIWSWCSDDDVGNGKFVLDIKYVTVNPGWFLNSFYRK